MISEPPYAPLRRRLGWSTVAVLMAALFQVLRAGNFTVEVAAPRPSATTTTSVAEPTLSASLSSSGASAAAGLARIDGPTSQVRRSSTDQHAMTASAAQTSGQRSPASMDLTLRAPRPGAYPYRWTVNGQASDGAIVVAASSVPSRETETTRGAGGGQTDTVDWSGGGRTVTQTVFSDGTVCQWHPAFVSLQPSLHAGAGWQAASSCRLTQSDGSSLSVERSEQAKVDGVAHTTVSGQPVLAWVIERHDLVTERSSSAAITTETQSTELFAPSVGLVVYRVARTATPNPDGSTAITTEVTELRSTRPG